MQNKLVIHGVPTSLARDAWWLSSSAEAGAPPTAPPDRSQGWRGQSLGPLPRLLALVLCADFLFWGHAPGLSLALFAALVFVTATGGIAGRHLARPVAMLACGSLPVLAYLQPLSLAFLVAAVTVAVVWARAPQIGPAAVAAGACRLLLKIPYAGPVALTAWVRAVRSGSTRSAEMSSLRQVLRNWAFPIGGTLVFATLLLDANPVLTRMITVEPDMSALMRRGMFWGGIGLVIWPFVDRAGPDTTAMTGPVRQLRLPGLGINAHSTLRALWMFNILIGVQTLMDLSIFVAGADLPDGMTYASYAHRGAYPLLMTGLLAGAFALAARPHLSAYRVLTPLMLIWLAQNVALSLSAALRLDLYVDVYGLTYLRLRALIWIGLVAICLTLAAWQVWKSHTNRWLVSRCAGLGLAALYLGCFVNFAAVIARENLTHWPRIDLPYICTLGPTAAGVLAETMQHNAALKTLVESRECQSAPPVLQGWRDWGLRNWQVIAHFDATTGLERQK